MAFRYTRLASTNVVFQAHAREDSRYVILAVMPPSAVQAWTVYDAERGEIISPEPFTEFIQAKRWLDARDK